MKNKMEHKYWGFLSYSRRDIKICLKLHKKLETLSLPKQKGIPKNLYPIFKDDEEMSTSSNLWEEIIQRLNDSNYLIVICTPNSKDAVYPNKEIEYFISQGKSSKIIALIHQASPFSIEDVMPETLRELYINKKLKHIVDMNNMNFNKASQTIAAYLLEFDYIKFMNYQRTRQLKRRVFGTVILVVLFFFISIFPTLLMFISPSSYYEMVGRYKTPTVTQDQAEKISQDMMDITVQFYNNEAYEIADTVLKKYSEGGLKNISISEIYLAISYLDGVEELSIIGADNEIKQKRKQLEHLIQLINQN
ncbi:toll/interleukin-1 receptor domain-containing protein [Marinicella sp. S1101]|uniref:toll/interleukin-1 receptor domain-containing protein n=1 Tax=Marinicella marina TaxID=2996016 RepID=UPI0022608DF3|nr:toll/interleukin-1 receptor domain-containing protein [Marinicella marina]MCX7553714.1 toll/interleukin-1 receptor domain-containing protein [Marinicella marina]